MKRTFYLVYRPDELGTLAQDIVAMVRVAVRELQRQWVAELHLPDDLLSIEDATGATSVGSAMADADDQRTQN